MNTILLQKILDILREGLAHVGNFFKDLFVSDPQDGQVIAYDADTGHWVNKAATEVELDLTNTFEAQTVATITDGAENVPMKSLVVDIVPKQASGTPTPSSPLPISGSDEVVITHTGKNRLNKEDITTQSASWVLNNMPLVLLAGTYTLSFDFSGTSGAGSFRLDDASGTAIYTYNQTLINGRMSYTFTINQTASFIKLYCGAYGSFSKFMLCEGAITTYEPYTATTFTKELPRIIYGGEVDVVSGSGRETMGYIASYNGESINEPWISSMDVYTPGGTPTTGAEVVYPLATPTHITTTPTTIKTKGGTESIWSDAGDVSGEYYTKTAGDVKSLVCITEDITSEITKNTTDFSDILLKVSQNNKVVSIEIYNATTAEAVNDTFLSNLPKPAMNCPVMVLNKTVGEEGIFYGSLSTSGALNITVPGAKSFGGIIIYVAK